MGKNPRFWAYALCFHIFTILTSLKHERKSCRSVLEHFHNQKASPESKSSSSLNITDADLVVINESAGSLKSCRLLDLTLLSLALTCNQSQPMLGSSAESGAYLENSSPEQWHWKVVSAQRREGGRVPSAMKRLTSGGQWGCHSPYHTVCWLTWAAPDQSLYLSLTLSAELNAGTHFLVWHI